MAAPGQEASLPGNVLADQMPGTDGNGAGAPESASDPALPATET